MNEKLQSLIIMYNDNNKELNNQMDELKILLKRQNEYIEYHNYY